MMLKKQGPKRVEEETVEVLDFKPMLAYHFVGEKKSKKRGFTSELSSGIDEGKGVVFEKGKEGHYVVNPVGWYMSKKLNGIRGIWYNGVMRSRIALQEKEVRVLVTPEWMKLVLPNDIILDGELYLGKDRFYESMNIIHGKMEVWKEMKYYLFDCYVENMPFAARVARLRQVHEKIVLRWNELFPGKECPIIYHKQYVIESWPRAYEEFKKWIVEDKEEGAILKNGKAMYKQGRSYDMLKWKVQFRRRAMIVGFNLKGGKDELKSLKCVWPETKDSMFSVSGGLNAGLRREYKDIFHIGDTILISYYEATYNDKPVSAVIIF